MQITKNNWNKYSQNQEKLRKKAAELMKEYIAANGTANRDDLVRFAFALIQKYGEAAAAYACEMYDAIAEMDRARAFPAEPAALPSYGDVAKAVNGSLLQSVAGLLAVRAVERLVKQAGEDTMLQNAYRDDAEFAWIPDGGACPYCLGIAAEGWKRATMSAVNGGHAEHIHSSCNCEYAIRFNKKTDVSGYTPEKYKEELASKSEEEIRAEQYEENKALIEEQKKEAALFNSENKTD